MFLAGCIKKFGCVRGNQNAVKKPVDGDIVTPYVKLYFGDPKNPEITVGNNSSPKWENTACIQSFELGSSADIGFSVTITDQQGGAFHLFMEKLNKCMARSSSEYKMAAEWGWIVSNCDGSKKIISSPKVVTLPTACDISFADGKVKFNIVGNSLMKSVFVTRNSEIQGTSKAKKTLKDAIRNLCENTEPKFGVKFIRINKDGSPSEYEFANDPKSVWSSDGQHKLAIIQKWLESFVTDRNKGIVPLWDASSDKPQLILLEDPLPGYGESKDPCANSIGTYIVNGGKFSPVISFTPKIDWIITIPQLATGGQVPGSGSGKIVVKKNTIQTEESGSNQSIPPNPFSWDVYGARPSTEEVSKTENAQSKANAVFDPMLKPITAELKIQGDPTENFVHPYNFKGKYLSIIVINPFQLFGSQTDASGCPEWLAQPGCNEILSNKSWLITGCSHQIKEGSYTTTVQLLLASPGVSLLPGEPLGGIGSEGYIPNNAC